MEEYRPGRMAFIHERPGELKTKMIIQDSDGMTWSEVLQQFVHFLTATGYHIDTVMLHDEIDSLAGQHYDNVQLMAKAKEEEEERLNEIYHPISIDVVHVNDDDYYHYDDLCQMIGGDDINAAIEFYNINGR